MSLTPKPLPLFPSNQILAKPPWPNSRVPPTLSSCHLLGSTRDKPAWPIPLPTGMGVYGTTTEGGRYFSALSFSLSLISLSYFSVFIYILLLFLAEFFSLFGCLWVWVLKGGIFWVWGLSQMAVCVYLCCIWNATSRMRNLCPSISKYETDRKEKRWPLMLKNACLCESNDTSMFIKIGFK